jgi:hypothetical protein
MADFGHAARYQDSFDAVLADPGQDRYELARDVLAALCAAAGPGPVRAAAAALAPQGPEDAHAYVVTVTGCTADQADQVMAERLGCDEDYGFDYRIEYGQQPLQVQVVVEGGVADVTACPAGVQVTVEDRDDEADDPVHTVVHTGPIPAPAGRA